jgi:hypothetical protein
VVVAAFLESFLWVAAFLYCFGKAFKKSDHWTQKLLAVWFSIWFIILRQEFWQCFCHLPLTGDFQGHILAGHDHNIAATKTPHAIPAEGVC